MARVMILALAWHDMVEDDFAQHVTMLSHATFNIHRSVPLLMAWHELWLFKETFLCMLLPSLIRFLNYLSHSNRLKQPTKICILKTAVPDIRDLIKELHLETVNFEGKLWLFKETFLCMLLPSLNRFLNYLSHSDRLKQPAKICILKTAVRDRRDLIKELHLERVNDHSWRCIPQTGTKLWGKGILRMKDAVTSKVEDADSQDFNIPTDHGRLARNCLMKLNKRCQETLKKKSDGICFANSMEKRVGKWKASCVMKPSSLFFINISWLWFLLLTQGECYYCPTIIVFTFPGFHNYNITDICSCEDNLLLILILMYSRTEYCSILKLLC